MAGISKEGIGLLILRFQLPKRYVLAVENDVFFERIRRPGLTLQGGYCDSLFRGGDCLRASVALRVCSRKCSDKVGISATWKHHVLLGKLDCSRAVPNGRIRSCG